VPDSHETANDCGIPNKCARTVPGWLVALDNGPTIALFVMGTLLLWPLLLGIFAITFATYCVLSIVMFWAFICPCCHHFGTGACPCGYGKVAPKFFKAKPSHDFRKVFKFNIAIMLPVWLVPLIGGAYVLYTAFGMLYLALFFAFCIDGFAVIPLISILVGCKDCEINDQCPWRT